MKAPSMVCFSMEGRLTVPVEVGCRLEREVGKICHVRLELED